MNFDVRLRALASVSKSVTQLLNVAANSSASIWLPAAAIGPEVCGTTELVEVRR